MVSGSAVVAQADRLQAQPDTCDAHRSLELREIRGPRLGRETARVCSDEALALRNAPTPRDHCGEIQRAGPDPDALPVNGAYPETADVFSDDDVAGEEVAMQDGGSVPVKLLRPAGVTLEELRQQYAVVGGPPTGDGAAPFLQLDGVCRVDAPERQRLRRREFGETAVEPAQPFCCGQPSVEGADVAQLQPLDMLE